MSSHQVNVGPETADGAIVAGPGPKSYLAKEIGNGTLRKSAKSAKRRHFVAAVSRGRGDAGDGVCHPAVDRPDGSRPLERRIEGAPCLWNRPVDRSFINGHEIRRLNGQNTEPNAGRSAPRWRPRPPAAPAPGRPAGLRPILQREHRKLDVNVKTELESFGIEPEPERPKRTEAMAPTVTEVDDRLTQAIHEVGQKVERQGERLAAIEESLGWVKKIGGFFATIGILVFSAMRSSDTKTSGLTRSIRSLTSLFNRQPKVRRPSRNPAAIKGRHFDRLFPNTVGLPNG